MSVATAAIGFSGSPSKMKTKNVVPKTMSEALEWDDPQEALMTLSDASAEKADKLAEELLSQLKDFGIDLPDVFRKDSDEITSATACADSILESLTKIATGGTQASQEIRVLEQEKRDLEQQAQDVEAALALRKNSDGAAEALSSQRYDIAAKAVQEYTEHARMNRHTPRALAYAGEYTLQQMETTQRVLCETLLQKYNIAVQHSDLQQLGDLTPLLSMVQLEKEGVSMYLTYLKASLEKDLEAAKASPEDEVPSDMPQSRASRRRAEERKARQGNSGSSSPPYVQMARVYNTAVQTFRYHLPMVSHYLHKADGDAAVVQLVHVQVEQAVVPLFQYYIQDRQLTTVARNAQRIYSLLEERYVGRLDAVAGTDESLTSELDDCGFSMEVGTLADVDGAMEEAALCLQHAESYSRFVHHTVSEVNKARELRYKAEKDARKLERERAEWATGMANAPVVEQEKPFVALEILPSHTQLVEVVTEVGGYYSAIERCLLLASMQRAFSTVPQYSDLGFKSNTQGHLSHALKTSLVDTCLFAARRSAQRAYATGHSGTASAMTNFCGDTLGGVLLEVMSRRAQEAGIAKLKPGDGLLEGSSSLFSATANNLMRQGQSEDEATRQVKMQQGIARACAMLNDLEVASMHVGELEKLLTQSIEQGFPPSKEADQLKICVKSLRPVMEGFTGAADGAVENLVGTLKPRVRSLVSDAVGSDSTTSTSFMSSSVGVGKDRAQIRMNYCLDEQSYKLTQVSEGYMSRLCSSLDEIIQPLRAHLSPRLSDAVVLGVLGTAAKRLESSLRRCQFTALGAIRLDADMRELLGYAKDCVDGPDLQSTLAMYRACVPVARMVQIARLLNVDDLEDVVDLISSSKRKGNWDLKLEDAKAFLSLRVEFEGRKVNELLNIDEE